MKKQACIIYFLLLFVIPPAFNQSPYQVDLKKELPFIGASAVSVGLGAYLYANESGLTLEELMQLHPNDVNGLDRFATDNYSSQANDLSDVFLISSHFTPLLFLAGKKSRSHFGHLMAIYGEAATLNLGLTTMVKAIARRPRPFVYNPTISTERKLSRSATTSFFSGHTSLTALNTFFVAKAFSGFYPDSPVETIDMGAGGKHPSHDGLS